MLWMPIVKRGLLCALITVAGLKQGLSVDRTV